MNVSFLLGIGLLELTREIAVVHSDATVVVGRVRIGNIGHALAVAVTGGTVQCPAYARAGSGELYLPVVEQVPGEGGILRTAIDGQWFVAALVEHA